MHEQRKWLMDAIEKVVGGQPLRRYSPDTINAPGMCAQAVRETVEGALGTPANTWEVAVLAHEFRKRRGGTVRWAVDYEQAARSLGLAKPASEMQPGDLLYWPYRAKDGNEYGHTALYAGNGYVLENSDANAAALVKKGAKRPLGRGQVFLTPLSLRGTPRLVAWPTRALMEAEQAPPATAHDIPAPPPKDGVRVMVNDGVSGVWTDLSGKRFVIEHAAQVTVNATDPRTVWIRYLEGGK